MLDRFFNVNTRGKTRRRIIRIKISILVLLFGLVQLIAFSQVLDLGSIFNFFIISFFFLFVLVSVVINIILILHEWELININFILRYIVSDEDISFLLQILFFAFFIVFLLISDDCSKVAEIPGLDTNILTKTLCYFPFFNKLFIFLFFILIGYILIQESMIKSRLKEKRVKNIFK